MHRMAPKVVVLVVALVVAAAPAFAQQDFSTLGVRPGDVVYVTEASGTQTIGRLASLSSSSLSIDGRDFTPAGTLRIERRSDPLWDGAVYGLLAGGGVGVILSNGECGSFARCTGALAGWGALFGTLIDWRHSGRTLIFGVAATRASVGAPTPGERDGWRAASVTARLIW